MKLSGAVALVTGANRGLGAAFVEALVARGARIYAGARDPETIPASGGAVTPLRLDVTDPASIAAVAEAAPDVTLLINNAGLLEQRGVVEAGDLDPFRREMEVNVFGVAAMSLAFAPVIAGQGGGAIVNILSNASIVPFPCFGSYSATKAAAMSLTHTMRHELADRAIAVHGVYAGFIDTGMVDNVDAAKTGPDAIVAAALDGVEAGMLDIATDAPSRKSRVLMHGALSDVLTASYERATGFRRTHPAQ
ncbi:MAG: SDR family NAD(P)-dependent oxidoreductase [Pseudomonadota bacterium]